MLHQRNQVGPESPRTASRVPSSSRLPEIDPALRPQLYPGRDSHVVSDCPADLLPHLLDGPIDLVTLPTP